MIGVFSWNDVDVLFTFNFDLELKFTFSQGFRILRFFEHYSIDGYHFVLNIIYHRLIKIELKLWLRVFSWNDLDVLFTFNLDLDLKLTFFQGHKKLIFFNIMPLTATTSYSA